MVINIMRLGGFKIYRTLLASLMLLVTTSGTLALAKTTEVSYFAALEDFATTDHSHEHGHSHDIEAPKGQTVTHTHDHNPADHSHDVPGMMRIPSQTSLYASSNWRPISATSQVDRLSFNIDRPPRF